MLVVGTAVAVAAAKRGQVPEHPPPSEFLAVPLGSLAIFAVLSRYATDCLALQLRNGAWRYGTTEAGFRAFGLNVEPLDDQSLRNAILDSPPVVLGVCADILG